METIYSFVCDPYHCDSLVEFHVIHGFQFPQGEIKMKCPCGRMMQYIGKETDDEYIDGPEMSWGVIH